MYTKQINNAEGKAMANKMQNSKLKTLYLFKILEKYSDEEHPISSTEIIEMLAEKGIKCERKSIYADIEALNEVGFDIVSVISPKRGFFMTGRQFEIPEVMLLIDAVTSAGFITPKKTESLIEKLKSLMSDSQAQTVQSQVYVDTDSVKCDNEEIYITIDRLHEAIKSKNKVKFIYKRRCVDKLRGTKFTEKTMTVSPYALIWKNDHYYLICNKTNYENLINLRIDRIKKLTVLDEIIRPVNEVSEYKKDFDSQDYSSKMFNMFSGEVCEVKLKCALKLQEEMIDRFGKNIPLKAVDLDHFETVIHPAVSDGFASWIMQYGEDIEVVEPEHLRQTISEKAEKILKIYSSAE